MRWWLDRRRDPGAAVHESARWRALASRQRDLASEWRRRGEPELAAGAEDLVQGLTDLARHAEPAEMREVTSGFRRQAGRRRTVRVWRRVGWVLWIGFTVAAGIALLVIGLLPLLVWSDL